MSIRRDFSIPQIDLSQETERQYLVDREQGLYIGHPTTVLLEDGKTIVAVYPKGHGAGVITLKKSFDGGKTWTERLPVPESWVTGMEIPTIFRTYGIDGTKHLLVFSGIYPIRMSHSEDDGETWSELDPIGDFAGIAAIASMICTGPGKYKAFYHYNTLNGRVVDSKSKWSLYATGKGADCRTRLVFFEKQDDGSWGEPIKHWVETKNGTDDWKEIYYQYSAFGPFEETPDWCIFSIESQDGGLTWSEPVPQVSQPGGLAICEPCVIASPDGREWAMIMRENSRTSNSLVCFSQDQGKTWSELYELPGALTGDRHTAKYLKDGRLFISFRNRPLADTSTYPSSGWVGWVGTYDDIRQLREGQYRVLIMQMDGWDCAYPGVEVQPDGTIVTTTYGHWVKDEQPFIICVRMHPNELDARLAQMS